jgi:hypothetical protein
MMIPNLKQAKLSVHKLLILVIEFHPTLSRAGSASPHILHHRPAFNIVRPVGRSVDLLR